jgi:hypothetical protein
MGRVIEEVNDQNIERLKSGQADRVYLVKDGILLKDLLQQRKLLSQVYDLEHEDEHMITFKKREIVMN